MRVRCFRAFIFSFSALLVIARDVQADFACTGVLTTAQREGFAKNFTPEYSPRLTQLGTTSGTNMTKVTSSAEVTKLAVSTPVVVARATLTQNQAKILKEWLNTNATSTVPTWLSTVVGIVVPQAWIGLAADAYLQLVEAQGTAGRLTLANLAGTVSEGGHVGVTEQIANTKAGVRKFIWTFIYQAELNQQRRTTPLAICAADVVLK
jgi:hypothetical protein